MTRADDLGPLTTPAHLGSLHPVESVVLALIAFGPLLVLALVVAWRRRQGRTGGGLDG